MQRLMQQWLGGGVQGAWNGDDELLGLPKGFDDANVTRRIANQLAKRLNDAICDGDLPEGERARLKKNLDAVRAVLARLTPTTVPTTVNPMTVAPMTGETVDAARGPTSAALGLKSAEDRSEVDRDSPSDGGLDFRTVSRRRSKVAARRYPKHRRRLSPSFTFASIVVGCLLFVSLVAAGKYFLIDGRWSVVRATDRQPAAEAMSEKVDGPRSTLPTRIHPEPRVGKTRGPRSLGEDQSASAAAEASRHLESTPNMGGQPWREARPPVDGLPSARVPRRGTDPAPLNGMEDRVTRPDPLSDVDLAHLVTELKGVRSSLAAGRLESAKRSAESAERIAKRSSQIRVVEAWSSLTHLMGEYWSAFDEAWNALGAGRELISGKARAMTIEIDDEMIVLRANGENRRYQRGELPVKLQLAIVNSWLDQEATSTQLINGAFFATQPPIDSGKARQLWQKAGQADGEVASLLLTLDVALSTDGLRGFEQSEALRKP